MLHEVETVATMQVAVNANSGVFRHADRSRLTQKLLLLLVSANATTDLISRKMFNIL